MKNTILTITFILLSLISNSQIITIVIDSVQNYTRPVGKDVFSSRDSNEITYTSFGDLLGDDMVLQYNLDTKEYSVDGQFYKISKVNKTDMAFDLVLSENGFNCFAKLSLTEDHKFVYVFEYEKNGIMDGFFWVGKEVYVN
jgi:hypothetical protein